MKISPHISSIPANTSSMSSADLFSNRQFLLEQLQSLNEEEEKISKELHHHFSALVGRGSASVTSSSSKAPPSLPHPPSTLYDPSTTSSSVSSSSIMSDLQKVERFAPAFEAIRQNSSKLATQVDDCRNLSERLSSLVRLLDMKQMKAQKALACTEDILNLKDCKFKIIAAIEGKDLSAAVGYLRQVHDIDEKATKTSDDYEIIVQKEAEVKEMVRAEFQSAVAASDTSKVMSLCPLLQTLGLETEARDNFLSYMEQNVFIGVSADGASVDGATDPSTAYAQALSSIFNATYLIIQQYLPMVIQGLENSLGDIYFLRKLHKKCEQEAGIVLKRYMKYRNVKEVIKAIKAGGNAANNINHAEVHVIMDELALLIQFCCKYSKYLRRVCHGAESKVRQKVTEEMNSIDGKSFVVFSGPQEFDRIVDELVGKYYIEGEQWLMREGMFNTLPRVIQEGTKLDECFFVLQKCGLRSIATNNIHASCAILNYISDIVSSDLLQQANQMLDYAIGKVLTSSQDHIGRYRKSLIIDGASNDNSSKGNALSKGFTNAISLASTLAGGVGGNSSNSLEGSGVGIAFRENGGFTLPGVGSEEDPWGTSAYLEAFNIVELCMRYTDRLNKDLLLAGQTVYDEDSKSESTVRAKSKGRGTLSMPLLASDMDKLKVCKENFDNSKSLFSQALRQGTEKIMSSSQNVVKEVISFTLGKSAIYCGVQFNLKDSLFDKQEILVLLPKIVTVPLETLVNLLTSGLSERNKDLFVGMLADTCCEKFELFINQNTFSMAGALKLEEIVRSLSSLFSRHSSVPVRGKFSRLREIMIVLTAENCTSVLNENFTTLTTNEVEAFFGLRIDST